jgi:transketolase
MGEQCVLTEGGDKERADVVLDERSLHLRRLVLRSLVAADKGHVGSALSLIEILRVLYDDIARHDPKNPAWIDRDRIILSKGHGCLALYAVLADKGYIPLGVLEQFCSRHSPIGGHPEKDINFGVEASTGALGHGLPIATGIALAFQRLGSQSRVFVVVGDGELNEGSNWEAMLIASKYHLTNLVVLVDHNAQQLHGALDRVLPMRPLREKFQSFGAVTTEVDGHSPSLLCAELRRACSRDDPAPRVVICHTIKGKGLAIAEQNPAWHYRRSFSRELVKEISEQWSGMSVNTN